MLNRQILLLSLFLLIISYYAPCQVTENATCKNTGVPMRCYRAGTGMASHESPIEIT